MKLSTQSKAKPPALSKTKSKGLTVAKKELEQVTPRLFNFKTADISAFEHVLAGYKAVSGTNLPELCHCGIALEGANKSGKSALYAGNDRLIVAKCYDGHPILPRCRAKVFECPDLATLEKFLADMLRLAKKQGKDSPYCQIAIDPISSWVTGLAKRAVEKYNQKKFYTGDGELLPNAKDKLLQSASDIEGYGPWNGIADIIENTLAEFGSYGWGWIAPMHYQWKSEGGFKGGMDFRPNIPPTTADRVARLADITVVTDRSEDSFSLGYESRKTLALGARVPLVGHTQLPNYMDDDCPPNVTSWDYFRADYDDACRRFTKDQTEFIKRHKAIVDAMRS